MFITKTNSFNRVTWLYIDNEMNFKSNDKDEMKRNPRNADPQSACWTGSNRGRSDILFLYVASVSFFLHCSPNHVEKSEVLISLN